MGRRHRLGDYYPWLILILYENEYKRNISIALYIYIIEHNMNIFMYLKHIYIILVIKN